MHRSLYCIIALSSPDWLHKRVAPWQRATSPKSPTAHLIQTSITLQNPHTRGKMTKRTKKVGITGKYGTRYGASLRKQVKKMEVRISTAHYGERDC
jgi:hypothetical protein